MPPRLAIGCMTGTSLDALDVALVAIDGRGLSMSAHLLHAHSAPLAELAPRLRALAEQHPTTAGEIARLSRDFALFHARTIRELLAKAAHADVDLICVHGQTVFHAPPLSWQLFNAPVLAHELQTPVVFDLRAADLAAGGEGAPITPLADWVLFRDPNENRLIVNLGGFCNVTFLRPRPTPEESIRLIEGRDLFPCNQILDLIARKYLGADFDADGRHASSGNAVPSAADALSSLLLRIAGSGRSLGTGDELASWVEEYGKRLSGPDLAATACRAIGSTIPSAAARHPRVRIVLAGGSVRNAALVSAIRNNHNGPVSISDELSIPASHREAACFAVLGALCQDQIPITVPSVTGVPTPAPISGCWTCPSPRSSSS